MQGLRVVYCVAIFGYFLGNPGFVLASNSSPSTLFPDGTVVLTAGLNGEDPTITYVHGSTDYWQGIYSVEGMKSLALHERTKHAGTIVADPSTMSSLIIRPDNQSEVCVLLAPAEANTIVSSNCGRFLPPAGHEAMLRQGLVPFKSVTHAGLEYLPLSRILTIYPPSNVTTAQNIEAAPSTGAVFVKYNNSGAAEVDDFPRQFETMRRGKNVEALPPAQPKNTVVTKAHQPKATTTLTTAPSPTKPQPAVELRATPTTVAKSQPLPEPRWRAWLHSMKDTFAALFHNRATGTCGGIA